jgi:uncharacterized membrane protein YjdF
LWCCWSGRLQHLCWLQEPSNVIKCCVHFQTQRYQAVFHRSYVLLNRYALLLMTSISMCTYTQVSLSLYICRVQPFLAASHSDMGDLAKCHKGFLKHNINIFSELIFCVTKGSMDHLRKGRGPQVTHTSQDAYHWST